MEKTFAYVPFNSGADHDQTIGDFLLVLVSKSPYFVSTATLINVESGHSGTKLSCASSQSIPSSEFATITLLVQRMSLLRNTQLYMLYIIPYTLSA